MSSRFPILNYKDLAKLARSRGFIFWRQGKGSHEIWKRPQDNRRTVIPNQGHNSLKRRTIKSILEDLEVDWQELIK